MGEVVVVVVEREDGGRGRVVEEEGVVFRDGDPDASMAPGLVHQVQPNRRYSQSTLDAEQQVPATEAWSIRLIMMGYCRVGRGLQHGGAVYHHLRRAAACTGKPVSLRYV